MTKNFNSKSIKFCLIIMLICFPNFNNAKEVLIFADSISYDEKENIIAKGKAKIFQNNKLIISDLIIVNKLDKRIVLPTKFTFKDENNNFFEGDSGFFDSNLDFAEFINPKIKLNDGSRIIGKKMKRDGEIDIISKAVYTPCNSRIKIGNFICPTWQLEGEKILHDNENLFLYQKHSKMRLLNTPVFYIPYIVTPSPLRKDRKSGFLIPSTALNFFDTKTSQSLSFPYYFNISQDKEMLFTPIFNYGGGIDSSQRFIFDYNQIISGGNFKSDLTIDSNFENNNTDKWLSDASLITKYNKNINENYRIKIDSALQTSKNYIQKTKPNDELSYKNFLSTDLDLEGFNLNKIDDHIKISLKFYQTNQENENNQIIPIVLPKIEYFSGYKNNNGKISNSTYEFYNIFRDKNSNIHAKNQQKISHKYNFSNSVIKYNSKILFNTEIYNQVFNTDNKLINNKYHTGTYYRLFPIFGVTSETPFKVKRFLSDLTIKPKIQLIISPGSSNSNKLSNEDSTNNDFNLDNFFNLNRYSGNDKLDNSKRLVFGLNTFTNNFKTSFYQTYEITENSNFHIEQGNNDSLSDLIGNLQYINDNEISYDFRYDVGDAYLKKQNINIKSKLEYGDLDISYLDENSKINNITYKDTETINYSFITKKISKFNEFTIEGLYDLKKDINKEYSIGYSYFDECFGVNINFNRKSYKEDNLLPQDILTLMFSFKNIGSYKSSNLLQTTANDRVDIEWINDNNNEKFTSN